MSEIKVAIDIGSHTARLLVSRVPIGQGTLKPELRKRTYIRLAEGFDRSGARVLSPDAMDRAVRALKEFRMEIDRLGNCEIRAVATGVVREAMNRVEFLNSLYRETGIPVKPVSGEEEALLTAAGVVSDFGAIPRPYVIFDLGGGTTEFFIQCEDGRTIRSIPLGAAVLSHQFLISDPPKTGETGALSRHIGECLNAHFAGALSDQQGFLMIGTGGTVTTLGLMINQLPVSDRSVERVRGEILTLPAIVALYNEIREMTCEDRMTRPGLDQERAGIIPAGSLVVIKILEFFKARQLRISLSDILEGILLEEKAYDT